MSAPSRATNPFATCWTDPRLAPLCMVGTDEIEGLLRRFQQLGGRGAIVGPHGVGKTTLARALVRELEKRGKRVEWRELHKGDRRDAGELLPPTDVRPGTLLVVDGYEQLSWYQRWRLRVGCQRRGLGILVTSHRVTQLPTLVRLKPKIDVALAVYRQLTRDNPSSVTADDVRRGFAASGGNLRDLLFHLYDLHESRR